MNNYDYFMLKVYPKRYYSYKPPIIYPSKKFNELSEDFINTLFRRYCKDPTDKIINRNLTIDYLGKVLLIDEFNIEISDKINTIEISLLKNEDNFNNILKTIQSRINYPLLYDKPSHMGIEEYKQYILKQYIDSENILLQVFKKNNNFDLDVDFPIFYILSTFIDNKYPKNTSKEIIIRDFDKAFSELSIDNFIVNISEFIHGIESSSHKKRFENIFINTKDSINLSSEERTKLERDNFRYRNLRETDIAKLLLFFSNDKKLSIEVINTYITHMKYILSTLKNSHNVPDDIPKIWKLNDINRVDFKKYIKNNSSYLYQDLFKQKVSYTGYNEYKGNNYIFMAINKYIEPYINDIHRLQYSNHSMTNKFHIFQINRYIFMFLLDKLVEFHNKVKLNDEEVLNLLEEYINISEDIDIHSVEQYTEYFIMDYITDIFNMHYDSKWIIRNTNLNDLTKRLSKQKEKEKQTLIHKLDTMSDEKRALTMEKQKAGMINFFKTSGKDNINRIVDEYTNSTDDERYNMFNNLISSDKIVDEAFGIYNGGLLEESINKISIEQSGLEEDTYMDSSEIDEDGQMGDELHEFHDEDLLDNDFK